MILEKLYVKEGFYGWSAHFSVQWCTIFCAIRGASIGRRGRKTGIRKEERGNREGQEGGA